MTDRDTADPPIEYDSSSGTYRLPYDASSHDPVGVVVAMGVAAIEDVDQSDLPPTDESVDTEAVDELLASDVAGSARSSVEIEFTYCGYHVTARPDDVILRSLDS